MRNGLLFLFILVFSGLQVYGQTDSSKEQTVDSGRLPARPKAATRAPQVADSQQNARPRTVTRPVRATDTVKKAPVRTVVQRPKPDSVSNARPRTVVRPQQAADSLQRGRTGTAGRASPAASAAPPAQAARTATTAAIDTTVTASQPSKLPLNRPSAYDNFMRSLANSNVFLKPDKPRYFQLNPLRPYKDLDWLVYLIGGIVLLLGIIRMSYLKYFSDLFRAFLNPTLSQRQLKDQLSQSPFPNFLLNTFFAISLGVYFYLLMYRQQYIFNADAWLLIPGLVLLVALVYIVKYLVLRFCGWLFGNADLADAYIFILYLINKVVGIMLVPFLVILAFCQPGIAQTFLYISIFFIILLVGYRYIRSYSVVKQYLSFSKLHFFLYLCAFEVVPVLILTKVLLIWLTGNP
ncbi:DUF4271 domain-containing protein [Chitinophaga japonensis]|uniref:Uncharacterized protein DUF4271 n=1 Tax=Chitinophaga japonensis TaxID=104662 RepID=A0A562TD03_CHIJA|nr:DUF4271 domain-containing protein [Chitinophaga japonensis]TWI91441.1 uncharacterized protein DUF4271 [Chitinophaga japonensis]